MAIPSFTSDAELEAALPSTYKGVTLKKVSAKGESATNPSSPGGKLFLALIQSLGKTPADLSVAFASDPANTLGVAWDAFRIKGVEAQVWGPRYYEIAQQVSPGTTSTSVNLGGRTVKRIVNPTTPAITYAWGRGDILFIVNARSDAVAGDAIAAVP